MKNRFRKHSPRRSLTPATIAVIVFLGLMLVRIFFFRQADATSPSARTSVTVSSVIDGDTFELTDGRRVRMRGINAPEAGHYDATAEPFAEESTGWLRARIDGQEIQLRFDRELKDHYGRLLAWVYDKDGILINQQMLSQGFAELLPDYGLPVDLEPSLRSAESEARVDKRGLWGSPRRKKK
jgi:micrococcal nuclease